MDDVRSRQLVRIGGRSEMIDAILAPAQGVHRNRIMLADDGSGMKVFGLGMPIARASVSEFRGRRNAGHAA